MKAERTALVSQVVAVAVGVAVATAGSSGGQTIGALPVFSLCVAAAFVIQWLVFVPSYALRTERFFDLTGSVTYLTVVTAAAVLSPPPTARSALLWTLVVIWAARLGSFLFSRVRKAGNDSRFDDLKSSFVRFSNVWTLQGLWVSLTAAAALAAITSGTAAEGLDAFAFAGLALWLVGFGTEAVADAQKRRFRADPANHGRFISSGLWAWSRHPNYFGEIVLWTGITLIALPALAGWQLVTLISPVFVYLLLTRISGIPLLEKSADSRWGGEPDYERYKRLTPVLVPAPPAGSRRPMTDPEERP